MTSSAAAQGHPTWSRSRAKPIAAAIAPASPSRRRSRGRAPCRPRRDGCASVTARPARPPTTYAEPAIMVTASPTASRTSTKLNPTPTSGSASVTARRPTGRRRASSAVTTASTKMPTTANDGSPASTDPSTIEIAAVVADDQDADTPAPSRGDAHDRRRKDADRAGDSAGDVVEHDDCRRHRADRPEERVGPVPDECGTCRPRPVIPTRLSSRGGGFSGVIRAVNRQTVRRRPSPPRP